MLMKVHKRLASQECGLSSRAAENLIVLFLNTLGLCRTPPRAAPRPGTAPSTYGRTTQPRAAHPHLSAPAPRAALRYWALFVPPPPERAAQKGPTPTNDTTPLPSPRPPRTRGEDPVGSRATHALNEDHDHHPPTAPHFFPGKGWGVVCGGGAWPGGRGAWPARLPGAAAGAEVQLLPRPRQVCAWSASGRRRCVRREGGAQTAGPEGGALPAAALSEGVGAAEGSPPWEAPRGRWAAGSGGGEGWRCPAGRAGVLGLPLPSPAVPARCRPLAAGSGRRGAQHGKQRGSEPDGLKARKKGAVWVRDGRQVRSRCRGAVLLGSMQVPGAVLRAAGWSLRSGFPSGLSV